MSTASSHPCPRCGSTVALEVTHCEVCGQHQPNHDEAPELWIGRVLDGKYQIEGVLGVGGMGMVFRARRVLVGDTVALKVLFPKFLESRLQRDLFKDEAIAAARLSHPNVVTIYDTVLSPETGVAYIAMELLEGRPLKRLLKERAPVPFAEMLPIMVQLCDGLAAAHAAHVIHRDLKPDNLFLETLPGGETRVKIVDFGIASMMDVDPRDEQRRLLGTLRYMAPEQARGEPVDHRADIYGIGVVLYEALTRKRVTGKTLTAIIHEPVVPPNDLLDEAHRLSPGLQALVLSLVAKDPAQRPPTVLAVKEALLRVARESTEPGPAVVTGQPPRRMFFYGLIAAVGLGLATPLVFAGLGR